MSYRVSARDEARRLGVRGWVRNLPSGDVEAEAQGPDDAVEAFIRWCNHGPEEANVTGVDVTSRDEVPGEASFEVTR